jgi:LacI family gluconate utilization system Gnt-I transcriptional repressor
MLPPLTTVHTPLARIGEEAAALLLKLMRREAVTQHSVDVGYTVVVRQSS